MLSLFILSAFSATATIKQVYVASTSVADCVEKNKRLPTGGAKMSDSVNLKMPQYAYMAAKTIVGLCNGKATSTKYEVKTVKACEEAHGNLATSFNMMKDEYKDFCSRIYKYIDNNGQAPNYCTSSKGTVRFENYVYIMAKILRYYHKHGELPNYCATKPWSQVTGGGSGDLPTTGTFAEQIKKLASSHASYLKKTANCDCTSSTLKSVAKTAMGSNPSNVREAAKKIVSYLNDCTSYDGYYDTYYGALGTWNRRAGNCCDLAHLVCACCRSVGIPAKYGHATCRFQSGLVTGHVFAYVYTGSKWEVADIVSDYNYLGYKNNEDLTTPNIYTELPF